MSPSISYKTFHNGKKYAYIVEDSWDPATKKLSTQTLEFIGPHFDSHKERDKVFERFKQYRSDPSLYKQSTANKSPEKEGSDKRSEYIPSLNVGIAPYLKLWEMLDLDQYFNSVQKNLNLPFDLNKYVSYLSIKEIVDPASNLDDWQLSNASIFDYSGLTLSNFHLLLEVLQKEKAQILSVINRNGKKLTTKAGAQLKTKELTLVLCDLASLFFNDLDWTKITSETFTDRKSSNENSLVLGLLLNEEGFLLDFGLLVENTPDTLSMMQFVKGFKQKFRTSQITVFSDESTSKLLDLNQLQDEGFRYVACEPTRLDHEGMLKFFRGADQYIEDLESGSEWGTLEWESEWDSMEWEDEIEEEEAVDNIRWRFKDYTTQRNQAESAQKSLNPKEQYPRVLEVFTNARENTEINKLNERFTQLPMRTEPPEFRDISSKFYGRKLGEAGHLSILTNLPRSKKSRKQLVKGLKQLWSIEGDYNFPNTRSKFMYTDKQIEGHIVACYLALTLGRLLAKILKEGDLQITETETVDVLMGLSMSISETKGKEDKALLTGYTKRRKNISKKLKKKEHYSIRSLCSDIFYIMDMAPLRREETVSSLKKKLEIKFPLRPELEGRNANGSTEVESDPSTKI